MSILVSILVPIGPTAEVGAHHNLNMNNKEKLFVKYYFQIDLLEGKMNGNIKISVVCNNTSNKVIVSTV